jgi:diguanylate cyclase (GGDEF)-like protein
VQQVSFSFPSKPLISHAQLGLVACIFLACLVGIFSRPIGYLTAFWPANAIMLGLLLRNPGLARKPLSWLYSWAAFVTADAITGSTLFVTLTLNTANVLGVLVAWLYLQSKHADVLSFQRQRSVLVMFMGCVIGAIGCTAAGAWAGSIAFGVPLGRSVALWMSGEFYNFILILPVFMAAPKGWFWTWKWSTSDWSLGKFLPLLALAGSEALSLVIGGPGAIAFIMPAMVWCAMTFGVFPMAILNVVVCFGKTAAIAMGALSFTPDHVMEATSYLTGLALFSLAPLAVACAYALRMYALQKLSHAVNHDFLTGVLARRALMERGQKLLSRLEEESQAVSVLMLDIDHFKMVNDRYGHAQGDVVLQEFAVLARDALRPEDLLGRMGGEEFAIVLPRTQREQAIAIGQRLCDKFREHQFPLPNQDSMRATLSVGLHSVSSIARQEKLEQLLSKADEALYLAKISGRDQVRQYGPLLAPSSV